MVSREKRIVRFEIIITLAIILLIISRIIWIIFFSGSSTVVYHDPQVSSKIVRGTIYDSKSNILAIETPYHSLAIHLHSAADINETIELIAPILSLSREEITEIVSKRSTYALIKRRLSTSEKEQLASLIKTNKNLGIVIEKRYGRTYPQVHHAAQIIGFTNTENKGLEGLELTLDPLLSPYPQLNKEITYGNDVYLTLDMKLQYILDQSILQINREHNPDSLVGLIVESKTGAIRAASTYPWYDPNAYWDSPSEYRTNAFSSMMREPGSVFKIFSLAAELDSGTISPDEHFYCDGSYTFTTDDGVETTINCVSPHGDVTPTDMIAKSCNGAVAHWSHNLDSDLFATYLKNFGFTQLYDIELPGTSAGYLAPVSSWSNRSKATISFGQEIAVTPLQIVAAATAIANKGVKVDPYLIESIQDHQHNIIENHKVKRSPMLISEEVTETILEGMQKATQVGGTAVNVTVDGVNIGAKTGTAQVADEITGGYSNDSYLASTLAIFPIEDPEYIIYIAALNPKGSTIWGSAIASPGISQVVADMVRLGYIQSSAIESLSLSDIQK